MDFEAIEQLTNEDVKELYNDILMINEEVDLAYACATFYVRCNDGTWHTGYGKYYSPNFVCGSDIMSKSGYCGYISSLSGFYNDVWSGGVQSACGSSARTGYSCLASCVSNRNC